MSEKDKIIALLRKVERRVRSNRLFHELAYGCALFLIFPVLLKVWDVFFPLSGGIVAALLAIWCIPLGAYGVSRLTRKGTLDQAAVSVDNAAGLHDEIKTALWFINNPRSSEWIKAQLSRAARHADATDVERLYPRKVPQASYIVVGLILTFVALNLIPVQLNHNWLTLQAAPSFRLSEKQQAILKQVEQLLKNQALQDPKVAERVEEILHEFQEGNPDAAKAAELLAELQTLLEESSSETAAMKEGLQEIAQDFKESQNLKETGDAISEEQLDQAAERLRDSAKQVDSSTAESIRQMQKSLEHAAEKSQQGLEQLSKDLADASQNLKDNNKEAAQQALEDASKELEKIQDRIQSEQSTQAASQQLRDLRNSLRDSKQAAAGQRDAGQQNDSDENGESQGESELSANGQADAGDSAKPGSGGAAQASGSANGLSTSDTPTDAPREGAPTKLDVLLQQESLAGMPVQGSKPQNADEISKQERSTLDYRNVGTNMSPSQKDVLNQNRIPWEYRPLIKEYFQAIGEAKK